MQGGDWFRATPNDSAVSGAEVTTGQVGLTTSDLFLVIRRVLSLCRTKLSDPLARCGLPRVSHESSVADL